MSKLKEFAWSLGRLEAYELCPKKMAAEQLYKTVVKPPYAPGIDAHAELASAMSQDGYQLPTELRPAQRWVDQFKAHAVRIEVEQKLSLNKKLEPTGYFARGVWFRGIADAIIHTSNSGVKIFPDWKSGKRKPSETQLELMALTGFQYFPEMHTAVAGYVWLNDNVFGGGKEDSPRVYHRKDAAKMWQVILPRVERFREAYEVEDFPATPNFLCKRYCPVTTCQFHGKGSR